jgi:hypothetical protein
MTENFMPPAGGPENACPFPDYRVAAMLIELGSRTPDQAPPEVICAYAGPQGECGNTVKILREPNLHGELWWHAVCYRPDGSRTHGCDGYTDADALEVLVDPGFDPLADFLRPDDPDTSQGDQ